MGQEGDEDGALGPGVGVGRPQGKEERNTKPWGQGGHRHTQLPGVAQFLNLEAGRMGRSWST